MRSSLWGDGLEIEERCMDRDSWLREIGETMQILKEPGVGRRKEYEILLRKTKNQGR